MLQSIGLQRVRCNLATNQQQIHYSVLGPYTFPALVEHQVWCQSALPPWCPGTHESDTSKSSLTFVPKDPPISQLFME